MKPINVKFLDKLVPQELSDRTKIRMTYIGLSMAITVFIISVLSRIASFATWPLVIVLCILLVISIVILYLSQRMEQLDLDKKVKETFKSSGAKSESYYSDDSTK